MSAPKVNVLAVLDDAAHALFTRNHKNERNELIEARAAVAELVEKTAALVSAGKRFRNTVVETRGVRGMDDHDAALRAAETALARIGGAA